MGARYVLKIKCPMCGYVNLDVYYAPTCGFETYECEYCGAKHDIAFALMAGKACEMEDEPCHISQNHSG